MTLLILDDEAKAGIRVMQQQPIIVYEEEGTMIDLLVEGWLIIELKSVRTLAPEHVAQIIGYLKSSRLRHGLLINFGSYDFQIKKYAL
jgi:GxxExxY protein